jgi:hypothetical protein
VFQNDGYEELSIEDIFSMSDLNPTNIIVNHTKRLIPRKIPCEYIPKINYFAPRYDNLLYCIVLDQEIWFSGENFSRKYFFSPSMTLIATLMRKNRQEILEMIGINSAIDLNKINLINNFIGNKSEKHIRRKRFQNITEVIRPKKVYYNGLSYNYEIPSKNDLSKIYKGQFKRYISFFDNDLMIYPYEQKRCDCGFNQASYLKYEHFEVLGMCSHIQLMKQSLSDPSIADNIVLEIKTRNRRLGRIPGIFNPFSPLDYPERGTPLLRKIIREALYNFLVPQEYIKEYFSDSKEYHKKNGHSWFRCELDFFLLSFNEVYDWNFLQFWINNYDNLFSIDYTCRYFGDFVDQRIERVNAEHKYNPLRDSLEHLVNGNWKKVYHYGRDINDRSRFGVLMDYQFTHDLEFNHVITDKTIEVDLEVIHMQKVKIPKINHSVPFRVSKVPKRDIWIYIKPYKMRKMRN